MKIYSIGVNDTYPEFLQRKIRIANQVGLIIAFLVALPFVFISLWFFPPLAFLPIIAIPIALSTLLFNYLRLHSLARIVIALVPICLALVYQAYLSKAGSGVTPGLSMIMLSFSLLVFVLFDLREKHLLIPMAICMLCILLSADWLNNQLEMDLDTPIIETGFLAKLTIVISLISGAGSVLILVFQNYKSESRTLDLLKEAEVSNKAMLDKELELKNNFIQLEVAQSEERKRQWSNEGLTQGNIVLRKNEDIKLLCESLISFIVKYLNANQGGLFLLNETMEEDVHLELMASYAFERKKFQEKRIEIGEGLVGQAYLEERTIYLTEVPNDYIHITSGLGLANPTAILIVPLIVNDEVQGILELASFKVFEAFEIQFVETLGETIAASIMSTRVNSKTKHLLEIAQQQEEEMRAQEEEMRQNMEELSATQEEMSRKEREYISKIELLERQLVLYETNKYSD